MKIEIKGFLNEGALRVRGLGGQLPPSLSKNASFHPKMPPHPKKNTNILQYIPYTAITKIARYFQYFPV